MPLPGAYHTGGAFRVGSLPGLTIGGVRVVDAEDAKAAKEKVRAAATVAAEGQKREVGIEGLIAEGKGRREKRSESTILGSNGSTTSRSYSLIPDHIPCVTCRKARPCPR